MSKRIEGRGAADQTKGYLDVIKKQSEEARAQRKDVAPMQRTEALIEARKWLEGSSKEVSGIDSATVYTNFRVLQNLLDWAEAREKETDGRLDELEKFIKRIDSSVGEHDNRLDRLE